MSDTETIAIVVGVRLSIAAVIVGVLAQRKNRNGVLWGIIAALLSLPYVLLVIVPLLVLMFMPFLCPKCKGPLTNEQWKVRTCPRCGAISTVE